MFSRLAMEFQRLGIAHEDAQSLLGFGRGGVERFGMQHPRPHILALQFGAELQQHRRTRLQHVAILRETLGEQHRLEMAGRIRQAHDAHLVAGLGAAFHARHHGRGNLAGRRAGFDRARKFRPGLHPQPLQDGSVIVERMAGQEETDGVVFAPQPLGRQPGLDLRQHDGRRIGGAAEHVVLPDRGGLMAALAG